MEGSDGRSAENTDMSEDEHQLSGHREAETVSGAIRHLAVNATSVAADGGVVTTTDGASSSGEGNLTCFCRCAAFEVAVTKWRHTPSLYVFTLSCYDSHFLFQGMPFWGILNILSLHKYFQLYKIVPK